MLPSIAMHFFAAAPMNECTMRFKKMIEGRGGWCEWQAPIMNGHLMKCCDCGLEHELQFKTFIETRQKKNGTFTIVEMPWPVRVLFRARRRRI